MSVSVVFSRASLVTAGALLALWWTPPVAAVTVIRTAPQEAAEPKYVALEEGGKAVVGGLCVDIMRAIERQEPTLQFEVEPHWQSLARLEAGLSTGAFDAVCGLLHTKERDAKFVFVDHPLFAVKYYLAVRADDNVQINNWDDVRKLGDQGIVLVISGFGVIKRLQAEGLRVDATGRDSRANIQKLLAGRGRFFYHRSPGIKAEIRGSGSADMVKLLPTVMDRQQFHMMVSKSVPAEAVEKMRKALLKLEQTGELKKLLDKWDED